MKTINSFRSKLFALTLALMASVSTFAYDYHGDLLCYNILTDSTVAVIGQSEYKTMPRYEYLPENLVIPSEVTLQGKTYKVVSIDQWAFYACTMLKSVTIPSSVTFIGLSAFQYCENLVNVDIPTSVTTVEGSAFSYTKWYDNLPDGEVYINNTLYRYKGTAPENTQIVVKDGTTRIAGFTFWNQSNIVAIELPQTLTDIEHGAFEGCTQLSSILIPKNVTFIGASAFAECTGLKEVICLAPTPPIAGVDANPSPSDWMFAGVDVANVLLYVPMESIELYRNADQWKDFQIRVYYGSEECNEYKHVKLSVISYGNKLIYSLVTDDGSEIPDVDSVWILNTDKEPLQKFYGQSRDTIDLLFLELGTYILEVYLNECVKRKIFFVHHPKMKYIWCDTWNVLELKYRYSSYTTKEDFETWRYYLAQDTIINNYTYTAVTRQTTKVPEGVYPVTIPEPEYVAAVRFTDDSKVYIYYDNTEYLLYDFNVQPGDELTVFAGINHYHSHHTNTIRVDEVFGTEISLSVFPDFYGDVRPTCFGVTKWVEGVGDLCGFITGADCGLSEYQTALLCAYKDGNTEYTTEYEEYAEYGCEYNSGENKEYILTLPGLQRTHTIEMYDHAPNDGKRSGGYPLPFASIKDTVINGKTYLQFGDYVNGSDYSLFFLREENNKVLIYSSILQNDLVLYDYTLELGDSLPAITSDHDYFSDDHFTKLDKAKDIFTYVVTDVSTITLLDGIERKKWTLQNQYLGIMEYVEGIGCFGEKNSHSGDFFRLIYDHPYKTEYVGDHLVCVSKNGQLLYSMPQEEMNSFTLTCECLSQEDTIAPEDLFPTLWGLQRTSCTKTIGEDEEGTVHGLRSTLMKVKQDMIIDGKQYVLFGEGHNYDSFLLREKGNKVFVYSSLLRKDLVLYDYTLEVGDSLPALYIDWQYHDAFHQPLPYNGEVVDYNKDYDGTILPADTFIVTNISTITLLDGKEHKKWTFNNGMQYVEGIGSYGTSYAENDFYQLIANVPQYSDADSTFLVCVSKDGKLLYQMDDAEMERLGAECLCDVEKKWSDTWCNQWNILSHGYQGQQDPLAAAHTSIFWLSNNTVNRDGHEYIPLMCSSSMPEVESTTLIGELRFTEDKQVYFNYDNTEYLLYDFDVQVGDTLDIFGGIELYSYSFVEQKIYPHVITKIDTLDDGRLQITSDAIVIFEDSYGAFEEKMPQTWIEGLGSTNGIVYTSINPGIYGDAAIVMLCAYRDDECVYKTDSNDPYWIDYTQLGCVYNEGDFIEGAFPILSGLQRTVCNEYCGETEDDNSANSTYKQTFDSIFFENDKPYILCNDFLLREEDNKILIYSQLLHKDLVLYDFTLEVGDSLPALYIDYQQHNAMDWMPYNPGVVDYNIDHGGTIYPADTFIVTNISTVTLLDGKEYKKWTFNNGMEYVEGIGMYGGHRNGDFFRLIQEIIVPCNPGTHLVCVSKNGKLLYQMDDAEMERLGAECLCDYDRGPRKDNAKDGQIGGRPTPTQWNQLEVVLRQMDNNHTILQAETFSYTLEDISQQVNNKTYFQLARQSTKDTATTKSVVGALHFGKDEDNRVYFLLDGVEYVLYDFTAEIGDTVEIFAGINNYPQETTYTHVVVDKDTTKDGACRMFLEVVFPDETTAENAEKVWLAGLGSVDGIVHNAAKRTSNAHAAPSRSADSNETESSVMLCAWREDSCLYTTNHPDYETFGCIYNQDPTSVEDISTSQSSYQKIIREGQFLILHNGKTYSVMGIEL